MKRVAGFVCWFFLFAQSTAFAETRFKAQQLQEDFAVLKRAYTELHPGLYRYNTKPQMDASFDALQAELSHDLTLREAYLAFSTFLAKVKCGHSYANFFNQPEAIAAELFRNQDRVPFYFRWIDRRMIVTRSFSPEKRVQPGTEVLAINGTPVATILDRLMTIARADGSNDAKRVNSLEVTGTGKYETFDVYFPLLFKPAGPRMELQIREPLSGKTETLTVEALTYEQRLAPIQAEEKERQGGDAPLWQLSFPDPHTAYLRMPTWALYNSKWDWKGFLDQGFEQMAQKKTATLILDLRGNEGGLSVGDVILSKLASQDLPPDPLKRLVRYRKAPDDLAPYLDTWDPSFKDWGEAAVDLKDGFYTLKKYDNGERGSVIKASGSPFKGRTYVLVDASNSSATFEFAQAVQQNRLGTLVGQPTGGNQRGINGGAFFFLRLPNSKIEIDLPLIGLYAMGERPDAGLQPDVHVPPSVKDIAKGVDTELEAVKALQGGPE